MHTRSCSVAPAALTGSPRVPWRPLGTRKSRPCFLGFLGAPMGPRGPQGAELLGGHSLGSPEELLGLLEDRRGPWEPLPLGKAMEKSDTICIQNLHGWPLGIPGLWRPPRVYGSLLGVPKRHKSPSVVTSRSPGFLGCPMGAQGPQGIRGPWGYSQVPKGFQDSRGAPI